MSTSEGGFHRVDVDCTTSISKEQAIRAIEEMVKHYDRRSFAEFDAERLELAARIIRTKLGQE